MKSKEKYLIQFFIDTYQSKDIPIRHIARNTYSIIVKHFKIEYVFNDSRIIILVYTESTNEFINECQLWKGDELFPKFMEIYKFLEKERVERWNNPFEELNKVIKPIVRERRLNNVLEK